MKIGLDIGGTKIEAIVLNDQHETVFRQREGTPTEDYAATLEVVEKLVALGEQKAGEPCTVGIGLPGVVSRRREGLMKNANSTWLNGKPFRADIEDVLDRTVRIENDANCFALHEAILGAGKEYNTVFGVIMGTGVGGGFVVNNSLVVGPNALTGEWGHNPQPWQRENEKNVVCYCGKENCIETFLSGPGFMQRYGHAIGKAENITDAAKHAQEFPQVRETLSAWYDSVAAALASVINILDPEVIVLGGGVSRIEGLEIEIRKRLQAFVFGGEADTAVRIAQHGDASGVFGAALLW